jgi:hypothetical protein
MVPKISTDSDPMPDTSLRRMFRVIEAQNDIAPRDLPPDEPDPIPIDLPNDSESSQASPPSPKFPVQEVPQIWSVVWFSKPRGDLSLNHVTLYPGNNKLAGLELLVPAKEIKTSYNGLAYFTILKNPNNVEIGNKKLPGEQVLVRLPIDEISSDNKPSTWLNVFGKLHFVPSPSPPFAPPLFDLTLIFVAKSTPKK